MSHDPRDVERDARADLNAQHCSNCHRPWGEVRECCTINVAEHWTACTDCCTRELHGVESSDTDESLSDVWHG